MFPPRSPNSPASEISSIVPLTIEVVAAGDRRRVAVVGELDLTTAPALEQRLVEELSAGHHVELDLSAVPFVDSSGLRALVQAVRVSRDQGTSFTLLEPLPHQVRRVIEVSGLTDRLPTSPASPEFGGSGSQPEA